MSSIPDKTPLPTGRSKARFKLPKGPTVAAAICAVIIIVVFITHGSQTTPPPYHRGSTVEQIYDNKEAPCLENKGSNWIFTEDYYVTVPEDHLPDNYRTDTRRESELFIGVFQGGAPIASPSLQVVIDGTIRQPPYAILFQDYSLITGNDRTAEIKVQYQSASSASPPPDLALVFYVKEHETSSHYGKAPIWGRNSVFGTGGCGVPNDLSPLSVYKCLENSNSHSAEHVVISEMPICTTRPE